MKLTIKLKEGFDKTHVPLQFRAFWNDNGACYLRTRIQDGKIIFLCAQLLNYTNTSVTNALESVRDSAFKQLIRDGGIRLSVKHDFFDKFRSAERIDLTLMSDVFEFINENSIWIEYYPPEFFSYEFDKYTEVRFDNTGGPVWLSRRQADLEAEFPGMEFSISSNILATWNSAMTAEEIKDLLRDKKWTMKQVAERWGITDRHISRVVNDMSREKHWDDAIMGLPALNTKIRNNQDSAENLD